MPLDLFKRVLEDLHANQYCIDCSHPVDEEEYAKLIRRLSTVHQLDRTQIAEFKRYMTLAIDMKGDPERLINPIRYIHRDDGAKEVSMGSSRLFAHFLMGADKIKAEPISYATDEERIDRELSENIQRTEMTDADIILALRQAQTVRGKAYTVTELSQKTAKSRGTANMIQKILSAADDSFFDTIQSYKSVNGMLKAISDTPEKTSIPLCEDEVVEREIRNAEANRLMTVNGHGSQMGSFMMFLNDFLGYQLQYYETVYDPDNDMIPKFVLVYMETQLKTLKFGMNILTEQMVRYNEGLRLKPARYIYDREKIQLAADILGNASYQRFEQLRGVADDIAHQRMLDGVESRSNVAN